MDQDLLKKDSNSNNDSNNNYDNQIEALNIQSDNSMFTGLDRVFLHCLKVFKLFVFLMSSGRLFHKDGSMFDKIFCLVLVLRKGCLSLAKLFLVSIYSAK